MGEVLKINYKELLGKALYPFYILSKLFTTWYFVPFWLIPLGLYLQMPNLIVVISVFVYAYLSYKIE